LITILDTVSWGKELTTGNAEFVETTNDLLYVVSNVRNNGFGFGRGFGNSFASPYQFVILKSDPVPPAPGPGASFGAAPPTSVPVATYTFPQPTTSFDPVATFDASTGLLHILGTRDTPTSGTTSSSQTNDLIKFTYDTVGLTLSGPFVIGASIGSRTRNAYDIGVLDTGNTLVACALTDPAITAPPLAATITAISISAGEITVYIAPMSTPLLPNQWVLLDGLTTATFLNGAVVQVDTVTSTFFTASLQVGDFGNGGGFGNVFGVNYGVLNAVPDTGTASAMGSDLFAVELDATTNQPVPGTATILASSPSRSGNTFDGVSLIINGTSVELYYESHPKLITFTDQVFTINRIGRNFPPQTGFGLNFGFNFGNFGAGGSQPSGFGSNFGYDFGLNATSWDETPTVLTTFTGRYSDNRLTVVQDQAGNRYLSLTYWSQLNHPEGIVGNVMMGTSQGAQPWFFHPTFGSVLGGSLVQSTVAVARNGSVNLAYLLEPFVPITNPPQTITPSWPLQIASVNPTTLGLTNVPGFYNTLNMTWLRGTKSLIDNESLWAVVGEQELATIVPGEVHTIPPLLFPPPPFTVVVDNSSSFFQNVSVAYFPSMVLLVEVATNPQVGQYTVDESIGLYTFNEADAGLQIAITYQYISQIVPIYASLFNVPPIARVLPTNAAVWRGGTFYATDIAPITSFSITSDVITVTAINDFVPGQQIAIYGLSFPADDFLNGNTLSVSTASPTQFTATFVHPDFTFTPGDTGFAAALIAGQLTLSAATSTDADADALKFIWTENDPNLTDIFLTTNGAQATVNVLKPVGPSQQLFDVGVAVIDLFPDLVTERHPALVLTDVSVTSGVITLTFTAPAGAEVPIAGEKTMLYDVVLGAPPAPTLSTVAGGSLPVQGAPGFGFQFGAEFGIFQPISVIITYVNPLGETTGSANSIIASVDAGKLLEVISPVGGGGAGDATGYNVYVGQVGQETLQPNQAGLYLPTPLGTNWIENVNGFTLIATVPPTTSGAIQEFLNNEVFTLTATTPTTLVATIPLGFGFDFGFDFGTSSFPSTTITGFAIANSVPPPPPDGSGQFARTSITVPLNVAPVATFPAPQWTPLNLLNTTVARNTTITITPGTISDPLTQFPVIYTGITDPDDVPAYQWAQTSGTTVVFKNGSTSPTLQIETNGVNLNGETLGFSLTLSDGINVPFVTNFSIPVAAYVFNAANADTRQLSRSIYSTSATVASVSIFEGIGTITTLGNSFVSGQSVWFENMTNAAFLNNAQFTILPTGFGLSFGAGFGEPSLSSTTFQIFDATLPNYGPLPDSGDAFSPQPISQRNLNATDSWSPLDISILYNDLKAIKRTSVLDGSDRYILISDHSVLVYGVFPSTTPASVLLSQIFLPNNANKIIDAVHTEQDYTLVLDNTGHIYRYFQGSFIQTDNPDVIIPLSNFTSLDFNDHDLANEERILTTVNFANTRVLTITGEQGALLLQVNTTTLAVTGTFELTVQSNFVYGANKVDFVRWVNMDNLNSGRVLVGTILNNQAPITNVQISTNALIVTCANNFKVGDTIVLSGLTTATFLNGLTVSVISRTSTTFTASYQHADYASAADTGLAQSQTSGSTFETLIDLTAQRIIGTFDKSKLRNQFVETGEIMFDPDDPYAGGPTPPVLQPITTTVLGGNVNIVLSWQQLRPDLISEYNIEIALTTQVSTQVPAVAPFTFQVPINFEFTADEGVFNGTVNAFMQSTGQTSPLTMQYNASSTGFYTFNQAQANNNVALTVRQAFNTFQVVNEGSVQSILASLPAGSTYFFRVQASGLDGTSGFSNIQSITL
jgi:hypothetical protein